MKVFALPYGKGEINIELNEKLFTLLRPLNSPPPLSQEQMRTSISNPIASPPLKELLHSNDRILIVVSDITRSTGVHTYLPLILSEIEIAGASLAKTKIIIALGNHRLLSIEEIKKILSSKIVGAFEIVQHNSKDSGLVEYIGKTSRNNEIYVNKLLLESDKVILTGAIGYHYFAGFTGGRKSIVPGLSGLSTIVHNHKLSLDFDNKKVREGVAPGILDGNPLNQDLEEAVSLNPPSFIVNSVLNDEGEIIGLFSGHWREAHRQGCSFHHNLHSLPIKEKKNLAIVSCGGYPKDINFIQSHKTLQYSYRCLKPGGYLILLAECPEGIGSPYFLNWFPIDNISSYLTRFKKSSDANGQVAFFLNYLISHFRILLVSSLEPEIVKKFGIQPAESIEEALNAVDVEVLKEGAYIIPKGSSTLPLLSN